jgi:hypothetical protein
VQVPQFVDVDSNTMPVPICHCISGLEAKMQALVVAIVLWLCCLLDTIPQIFLPDVTGRTSVRQNITSCRWTMTVYRNNHNNDDAKDKRKNVTEIVPDQDDSVNNINASTPNNGKNDDTASHQQ